MKKIYIILFAASLCSTFAYAQTLYNKGGTLFIRANGKVHVRGSLTNGTGATLTNNGILEVSGNSTNDGNISAPSGSAIVYEGTAPLVIAGSQPVVGENVTINNAAGVTLNTPLQIKGALTFTAGIINATSQPVVLTSSATVTGASDASHVNGTVVKEGTGAFTYPVGDGTKYQKVEFNATANATGISVRYYAASAGTGSYTTTGSDALPLENHNTAEYWDIAPRSTATGTVTLFWDGQADAYTAPLSARRVAHFKSGDWLNEGGIGIGTLTAGSVTSNEISTFSPFALGSVSVILPVKMGTFTAKADGNRTKLEWNTTSELNNSHFIVGRSATASNFVQVAKVNGNGTTATTSRYTAYDYQPANGLNYYRLTQVDANGTETELGTIPFEFSLSNLSLSAYPNPSGHNFNVLSSVVGEASITSVTGQLVKTLQLVAGINTIDASSWPVGIYVIKTAKASLKLVKK